MWRRHFQEREEACVWNILMVFFFFTPASIVSAGRLVFTQPLKLKGTCFLKCSFVTNVPNGKCVDEPYIWFFHTTMLVGKSFD